MTKKEQNTVHPIIFEEKEVRRTWHNDQWYFSLSDVVQALTDSNDVKQYIKKMRTRDAELSANWGTLCTPLQIISKDGKRREENTGHPPYYSINSIPESRTIQAVAGTSRTGTY